jgi:ABC-2 type transport system permease protein
MSLRRILAILLQEIYITQRSLEVIIDLFFFSTITIVGFGLTSVFLTGQINGAPAYYLILGLLLWEIIRVDQYSISVGALWNIWSRNLSNMFVAPLTMPEYIGALMFSAVVKSSLVFILLSLLTALLFDFNIFGLGLLNLALFFLNLTIFSWTIGLLLLGLIFLYGTRIQALAWGLIFLFQPLVATFFPVEILPSFLQPVSYLLPPTYVFEAARSAILNPEVNWVYFDISLFENLAYLLIGLYLFRLMFRRSKNTGQFARNEG